MNPRNIINFLLQEKDGIYNIDKEASEDYTKLFNYCKSKGFLMQSGNDYCRSAPAEDLLHEDSEKSLDIKILEYLKYEKAIFSKIEVAAPFLLIDDSREKRVELSQALGYLAKNNYIELSGYAPSLADTQGGKFSSKYITGIKAYITKLGEKEIEPEQLQEVKSVQNIHHGHIINAPITQSDFSNSNDNSLHTQTVTNTAETKSPKRSKIEILYWVIGIIVGLIVIYEFLHKIHFVLSF